MGDQISPDAYIFIWPQAVFLFVFFLSGVYFQCKRKRTDDQATGLALARVRSSKRRVRLRVREVS